MLNFSLCFLHENNPKCKLNKITKICKEIKKITNNK